MWERGGWAARGRIGGLEEDVWESGGMGCKEEDRRVWRRMCGREEGWACKEKDRRGGRK